MAPAIKLKSEANSSCAKTFDPPPTPLDPKVYLLMFATQGWLSLTQMLRVDSWNRHISISCAALSEPALAVCGISPFSMAAYKKEATDPWREH